MKTVDTAILATALLVSVVGGVFVVQAATVKKTPIKKVVAIPKKAPVVKAPKMPAKSDIDKSIDGIKVNVPNFDLSASPIPNLKIAPLNLALPQLPGKGMMKNFTVNTNVGYTGGAVNIPTPKIDVSQYMPKMPPVSIPTAPTAPAVPTIPTTPSTQPPSSQNGAPAVNAASCAQFNGIPSCNYVADPSGQTMCNQCKSAGF